MVTNQAGIARGYYTEQEFLDYMEWVKTEFIRQGAHIDAIYYCPHHPEHGLGEYHRVCSCRKPAPGMLIKAAHELDIDLSRSVLVGDKPTDLAAGQAAGIKKCFLLEPGSSAPHKNRECITSLGEVDLC